MAWDVPRVTVDAVVPYQGKLVLVRRGKEPFKGRCALPGGFVEFGERLEDAVEREVEEETGLQCEVQGLLGVFGNPARDPRGHTITVAYLLHPIGGTLRAASDAAGTRLVSPANAKGLAFDHDDIVRAYRKAVRDRTPFLRPTS